MIGCACLAALPMTSGYFSKDAILVQAYENHGIDTLWIMAWSGALLTGLYSFRLIFVVFFGEENKTATEKSHWSMRIPLFILCILALAGGLLHPDLHNVFNFEQRNDEHGSIVFVISAAPIIGIFIAYLIWGRGRVPATPGYLQGLKKFLLAGWGFDHLYDTLLIKPLTKLSQINRNDIVDSFYILLSALSYRLHNNLSATQNGQLRWFVAATAGGAIIIMALVML
jgi:NADH-quinone oxidoreductase subunit L